MEFFPILFILIEKKNGELYVLKDIVFYVILHFDINL